MLRLREMKPVNIVAFRPFTLHWLWRHRHIHLGNIVACFFLTESQIFYHPLKYVITPSSSSSLPSPPGPSALNKFNVFNGGVPCARVSWPLSPLSNNAASCRQIVGVKLSSFSFRGTLYSLASSLSPLWTQFLRA